MSKVPPPEYTDNVPDFSDTEKWQFTEEWSVDFYDTINGKKGCVDWGIDGCQLVPPEKSEAWRRIGIERRYTAKNNPNTRGYSTTYFDDKIPQFLLWCFWYKNDQVWRVAIHMTGDWWLDMDWKNLIFNSYQSEAMVKDRGRIIQQIYFVLRRKDTNRAEYIFKENPNFPLAKLKKLPS